MHTGSELASIKEPHACHFLPSGDRDGAAPTNFIQNLAFCIPQTGLLAGEGAD